MGLSESGLAGDIQYQMANPSGFTFFVKCLGFTGVGLSMNVPALALTLSLSDFLPHFDIRTLIYLFLCGSNVPVPFHGDKIRK